MRSNASIANNLMMQELIDLFYMIKAGKELETKFIPKKKTKIINNKEKKENKRQIQPHSPLEKEVNDLKNAILSFEEKYGYISPYHDDIVRKLNEKKTVKKITADISKKIMELYQKKYYNDCYDLWSIYEFKPLLGVSPEENFEILRNLTKVKDEISQRKNLIDNLDNYNLFNENNTFFEDGIFFSKIHDDKGGKNNSEHIRGSKDNSIIKEQINDDNLLLEEMKRRELNL